MAVANNFKFESRKKSSKNEKKRWKEKRVTRIVSASHRKTFMIVLAIPLQFRPAVVVIIVVFLREVIITFEAIGRACVTPSIIALNAREYDKLTIK